MKILVQNQVIDTENIVDIVDVEADKKMFLNREAGFIIRFMDNTNLVFKENIPYESYPSEISAIKSKWKSLMENVVNEWNKDKAAMPVFKV